VVGGSLTTREVTGSTKQKVRLQKLYEDPPSHGREEELLGSQAFLQTTFVPCGPTAGLGGLRYFKIALPRLHAVPEVC